MKPDHLAMKVLLRKRQMELQKIIKQMKQDQLQASPVYRNLEQELESLRNAVDGPPSTVRPPSTDHGLQ